MPFCLLPSRNTSGRSRSYAPSRRVFCVFVIKQRAINQSGGEPEVRAQLIFAPRHLSPIPLVVVAFQVQYPMQY